MSEYSELIMRLIKSGTICVTSTYMVSCHGRISKIGKVCAHMIMRKKKNRKLSFGLYVI